MRYLVKNKNTIMFAFAILLCAIIASCEDAKYDTIGSRIYLAESSSLSYESKKVTVAEEGSVVTVTPRSGQIATEDIEVTLGLSPKSLEVYNLKSATPFPKCYLQKRNGLLIRKTAIKSSRPFHCAYHPLTP